MTKLTKTGNQFRLSVPKDILQLTGWDENTELILIPYIKEPNEEITNETPILIKRLTPNDKEGV
ncbi:hypothetical protein [uncultured Methanolobus sp.]|uniref:hypothetical protein n=1 Tax=uncultured Methanolobus sp. TaxID=218300 RepID=UPI002AAB9768|nr:hypothetical protein [uncultured Methanolobus sp.]